MKEDLSELKELVAAIKADALAQKNKAKGETWTKYVSLFTVCMAVLGAFGMQRSAAYGSTSIKSLTEATLNQAHASDQWAFYQAKGLKQAITELEADQLRTTGAPSDAKALAELTAKVARYEAEKKAITAEAKAYEEKREAARADAVHFGDAGRDIGLAAVLAQIAVAIGGVCLLVKKRWLWYLSSAVGAVATVEVLMVFMRV